MSNPDTFVSTDLSEGVFTITLNRPKVNAFTTEMVTDTQAAFEQAARDKRARCVILIGSGDVFSAGHDVNDILSKRNQSFRYHLQRTYNPLVLQIRRLEKPVLGALNGPVSGAAVGIALACDLRIAAETASLVVGSLGIGLTPDAGTSLLLPTLVGLGRASEYIFSNRPLEANDALELGLVNRVVPAEELPEQAARWASQLAAGPVHAMGLTKRAFNQSILANLEGALDYEAHMQDIARKGAEHAEGLEAFIERRPADFISLDH